MKNSTICRTTSTTRAYIVWYPYAYFSAWRAPDFSESGLLPTDTTRLYLTDHTRPSYCKVFPTRAVFKGRPMPKISPSTLTASKRTHQSQHSYCILPTVQNCAHRVPDSPFTSTQYCPGESPSPPASGDHGFLCAIQLCTAQNCVH
jgi:hypothetical protein